MTGSICILRLYYAEETQKNLPQETIGEMLRIARARREQLLEQLHHEQTDCYRIFHGVTEGWPGLAVDRFGPQLLVQTFRERLLPEEQAAWLEALAPWQLEVVFRHRPDGPRPLSTAFTCRELGRELTIRTHHKGLDPYLFLDLRVVRRWLDRNHQGSLLNLFAYTGAAGVVAAGRGSSLNVDFSRRHLDIGRENAIRNGVGDRFEVLCEDVWPVVRQLAGLPVKGRGARRPYQRLEPRQFDTVLLDPPTLARSAFGAVDIRRDYPALARPALGAVRPGGKLIATHHLAEVPLEEWLAALRRTGDKWGRPLGAIEVLEPDGDFPSPDGRPPLKIALAEVW